MNLPKVSLQRLLIAVALFGFTGLMSVIAWKTGDIWPVSVALIVIGTTVGYLFHGPVHGTLAGIDLAGIDVMTRDSEGPFSFYVIALPWIGTIVALYFERVLIAVAFFVACIALTVLLQPGI